MLGSSRRLCGTAFLCLLSPTFAPSSAHGIGGQPMVVSSASEPILLDVTGESGVDFVHFNGTTGEYLLPEITGSGGALFDYDNDGDLDLYVVQGAFLKHNLGPNATVWDGESLQDRLYRNDLGTNGVHGVHYTDVTAESGIRAPGYGMGVATGDFNNDGWTDLYVTNLGSNQLFRNNTDGTFTDVTAKSGADDQRWSTSATFFDYDRDGWLDLFVTNYVNFSPDLKRECFSNSSSRDYCGPSVYAPAVDRLLHNRGDGTFQDVTSSSGISKAYGPGLGVIASDFNGDGWADICVANDGDLNQLWVNKGGKGRFEEVALMAGVAVNHRGQAEASMGLTAGDFDGDGDEDLFMTHLDRESNTLYVNLGNGLFQDRSIQSGLHATSLRYTSFGTGFFDYDNDGSLDLLVLNGGVRISEELARRGDAYPLHQPNQLFRNNGGRYEDITAQAGPAFDLSEVSRGAAFGDLDNDGDTDVVIFNNSGRTRLLLNQVGNRRNWLGLKLLRADGKRTSFQARVEVIAPDGSVLWRRGHSDGSYCSASDPRIIVGLGDNAAPTQIRVHWPDGKITQYEKLAVNRYWAIQKSAAPQELQLK